MLDINKQKMQYSKQGQRVIIYERDDDGNVKYYVDTDGNKIPLVADEKIGFSEPVEFRANISNKLSEVLVKEFGIDDSSTYVQIVTDKGYLPLKSGDIVWKQSKVERDSDGLVDPLTADYTVKGVADEGLTVDLFLLQKVVK
jgi:hypothetical protein